MATAAREISKETRRLRVHCLILAFSGLLFLTLVFSASGDETRKRASTNSPPSSSSSSFNVTGFRNTAPGVRYVGSKVCAGCHASIAESFSRTAMAHSTMLPDKLFELGWLNKPVDIFNEKHNRHYQIYSHDLKVYQAEYGLDDEGKEAFRHTEELAYLIGTGVNGDTPVVRRGNFLFQAPLSYYAATKSWGLSPNYEVRDMAFGLPVTADCMGCHSGQVQAVAGREGLYNDPPVKELGIGCENCHGPGELHVQERLKGAPESAEKKIDRSIVNPAKLSPWLADNICMNCHEGDIRALQPGKVESDFRPGTPLNNTVVIVKAPIDTSSEQSPLLEHYYSMTLSKCYRGSNGKMGCQSCHDPHVQPSREEAPQYFRGRCLTCHTEKGCTLDLQKRLIQQPADACTNCHMSKRPALTVSHASLTDHRITRAANEPFPEIALKPSLPGTGFIYVNAVPGKPDNVPPTALLKAYRKELIRGHLEFKDAYFSLLDQLSKPGSKNKDPFVLSAIAQKAGSDGDLPKAIRYARLAIEQGSASDSDYLLLDGFLARSNHLEESIDTLKKAIAITPYSSSLYESLAARQLAAGKTSDLDTTLQQALALFPEDSTLRDMRQQSSSNKLVQEGIARFKQGDLPSALEQFRAAVKANPKNAVAHDYAGIVLGESGKLEDAISEFQQSARLDPTFPEPHLHLGLAHARTGKTAAAISEYQAALLLNPKMPEAQYGLSAICAKVGDLDGAIILLRKVIDTEPDFAEAHFNLGLNIWNRYKNSGGLRQKSDLDEAVQELKRATELDSGQSRQWFALGQILADRGDLDPAIDALRKTVDLQPGSPEYHYNLGLALRLKGDMNGAGDQFRATLKLSQQHALAHRSLGLVLRETGDFPAAAEQLRISVAELPDDAQGHHLLATVLLKQTDSPSAIPEAIKELRKAKVLDPTLTDVRATLAQTLQKAGRKEEAQRETAELQEINLQNANVGQAMLMVQNAAEHSRKGEFGIAVKDLQQAVTLSPGFTEAWFQLALALRHAGDSAKAEEAFRRALQLDPDHAAAHYQLGTLLASRGDKAGAASELTKATELAPGMAEAHLALGKLAAESQDWASAIREYRAALVWVSSDPTVHYDLASVLKAGGQAEEAARELALARELDSARAR